MKKMILILTSLIMVISVFNGTPQVYASSNDDLLLKYLQENNLDDDSIDNYIIKKYGTVGNYDVYYGRTQKEQEYKSEKIVKIATCQFSVKRKISPYNLGVFIIKDNEVYKLGDAYQKRIIGKSDVYYIAYKLFLEGKDVNWRVDSNLVVNSLLVTSIKKKTIDAGKTLNIKVDNIQNKWTSSNKKVAIVKDGKVTALKKGKVQIIAYNFLNGEAFSVEVKNSPKLIKGNKSIKKLKIKKGHTATINIKGKTKKIKNTYYSTKNAKVLSKRNSSKLKILGRKTGSSTLKIIVNKSKTLKLKVLVK